MTRLGWIKLFLEAGFTALLVSVFPFTLLLKCKFVIVYVLIQILCGRYRHKAFLIWDEAKYLLQAYGVIFVVSVLLLPFQPFAWRQFWMLCLYLLCDMFGVALINRYAHHWFWRFVHHNVLIIGVGSNAAQLAAVASHNHFSLLEVQGFVDVEGAEGFEGYVQEIAVPENKIHPFSQLDEIIQKDRIDTVLVALPGLNSEAMDNLCYSLRRKVPSIKYLPIMDDQINFSTQINDFDGLLMISTSTGRISTIERFFKRIFDVICSIPGILLVGPLYLYIRHLYRKEGDTAPIFFKQKRIGRGGRLFTMYKFRSMVPNAEKVLEKLLADNPELAEEYRINRKLDPDPRTTKTGEFIRRTSLDEFPQFINVFKGDMSMVGPRPYLPGEKEDMGDVYEEVIATKPGITGMWQTHGRSDVDFKKRLRLDSYYYNNWSPWLDITLLLRTVKDFVSRKSNSGK